MPWVRTFECDFCDNRVELEARELAPDVLEFVDPFCVRHHELVAQPTPMRGVGVWAKKD